MIVITSYQHRVLTAHLKRLIEKQMLPLPLPNLTTVTLQSEISNPSKKSLSNYLTSALLIM